MSKEYIDRYKGEGENDIYEAVYESEDAYNNGEPTIRIDHFEVSTDADGNETYEEVYWSEGMPEDDFDMHNFGDD